MDYKQSFLQCYFDFAFDGYSYQGHEDSSNQSYDDLLDTFVFSDLRPIEKFPEAFHSYLNHGWKDSVAEIETIEATLIEDLKLDIDQKNLAHMASCNYYPPTESFKNPAKENTRLSSHPDVSLFTVFPFGVEKEFSFQSPNREWVELEANNHWGNQSPKSQSGLIAKPKGRTFFICVFFYSEAKHFMDMF